jgi:hypothetical protein
MVSITRAATQPRKMASYGNLLPVLLTFAYDAYKRQIFLDVSINGTRAGGEGLRRWWRRRLRLRWNTSGWKGPLLPR